MHQALAASGYEDVVCYEDRPIVHSALSAARRALWDLLTLYPRLLLLAETGTGGHLLSQNMLVCARKAR